MLSPAILESFLYVHVTHHITQSCMKETFGDNCIEALTFDCDETCRKWQGVVIPVELSMTGIKMKSRDQDVNLC